MKTNKIISYLTGSCGPAELLLVLFFTSVRKWDIFVQSRGSTDWPHLGSMEWTLPISAAINLKRENIFSDEPGCHCYCTNNHYQSRNTTPFPFNALIFYLRKKEKKRPCCICDLWLLESKFSKHLSGDMKFSEYSQLEVPGRTRWLMCAVALAVQPSLAVLCPLSWGKNNDVGLLAWGWWMAQRAQLNNICQCETQLSWNN